MRISILSALASAALFLVFSAGPAQAQVSVQMQGGQITIHNTGYDVQEAVQSASKAGNIHWVIDDNQGNVYQAAAGVGADILMGAYQDDENTPPPPGGGYQDAKEHLITVYGAVIVRDSTLGVDLVTFPNTSDPVQHFFNIITTDTLVTGAVLMETLGMAEIPNVGLFDDPAYAVPSTTTPYSFPNDPYYDDQWNLEATTLSKVVWHPTVTAQKAVRISVIDSGIGTSAQSSDGLDGMTVTHKTIAATSGSPVDHGLSVVSLLSDKNDDNDGIGGLLGSWGTHGCYERAPMLSTMRPEVFSYNVGDYAPGSIDVARAIHASIADGVDVINLSLRMAYSPLVEDAITAALDAGITVVAAAGNYAAGATNKTATFPASLSGVIAVAAGDVSLHYIDTSANEGVDLIAPGGDILVGRSDGSWHEVSGTSFAAPHVTAVVALMIAIDPTLTPADIAQALKTGANQSGGTGSVGFLDAGKTINKVVAGGQHVVWHQEPFPHEVCSPSKGGSVSTTTTAPVGTERSMNARHKGHERPALTGTYPNPFNPETTISFQLPGSQRVRLAVYNALGQQVQVLVEGMMHAGSHQARFAAHRLPSGTYFTRLETEAGTFTKSILLMK